MENFNWREIGLYSLVLVGVVLLSQCMGCSALVPDEIRPLSLSHVSHPSAGYPTGPANEEDTLDTLGSAIVHKWGHWHIYNRLAFKLRDGGVYGPDLVYQGQVEYVISIRK